MINCIKKIISLLFILLEQVELYFDCELQHEMALHIPLFMAAQSAQVSENEIAVSIITL